MGWQTRSNGKRFFYRSYRDEKGTVRSQYIGTGSRASKIVSDLQNAAKKRRQISEARRHDRDRISELTDVVEPLIKQARETFDTVMTVAGYRRYPAGKWRRRRSMNDSKEFEGEIRTVEDAIRAAEAGDNRGLPAIHAYLNRNALVWKGSGDAAILALRQWLHKSSGGDVMQREMLNKKQADLRARFTRDENDPVERLLVDRIILTWLRLNYFERVTAMPDLPNVTWQRMYAEQLTRAERSHRTALDDYLSYQDRATAVVGLRKETETSPNPYIKGAQS